MTAGMYVPFDPANLRHWFYGLGVFVIMGWPAIAVGVYMAATGKLELRSSRTKRKGKQ